MEVGRFTGCQLPQTPGCYDYEPFWCDDHDEMLAVVQGGQRPVCYYHTRQSMTFFTVCGTPKPGVLELCDFESGPPISPDRIVEQLAGLFQELAERQSFSDIARVPLAGAGAFGRGRDLFLWQCETDVLALPGIKRRCWIVDSDGLHPDRDPFETDELMNSPDWFCEHPSIRFATDGEHVYFAMRFGPRWHVSRIAPIGPDGKFISDQLVDANSYLAAPEVQRAAHARESAFHKRLRALIK